MRFLANIFNGAVEWSPRRTALFLLLLAGVVASPSAVASQAFAQTDWVEGKAPAAALVVSSVEPLQPATIDHIEDRVRELPGVRAVAVVPSDNQTSTLYVTPDDGAENFMADALLRSEVSEQGSLSLQVIGPVTTERSTAAGSQRSVLTAAAIAGFLAVVTSIFAYGWIVAVGVGVTLSLTISLSLVVADAVTTDMGGSLVSAPLAAMLAGMLTATIVGHRLIRQAEEKRKMNRRSQQATFVDLLQSTLANVARPAGLVLLQLIGAAVVMHVVRLGQNPLTPMLIGAFIGIVVAVLVMPITALNVRVAPAGRSVLEDPASTTVLWLGCIVLLAVAVGGTLNAVPHRALNPHAVEASGDVPEIAEAALVTRSFALTVPVATSAADQERYYETVSMRPDIREVRTATALYQAGTRIGDDDASPFSDLDGRANRTVLVVPEVVYSADEAERVAEELAVAANIVSVQVQTPLGLERNLAGWLLGTTLLVGVAVSWIVLFLGVTLLTAAAQAALRALMLLAAVVGVIFVVGSAGRGEALFAASLVLVGFCWLQSWGIADKFWPAAPSSADENPDGQTRWSNEAVVLGWLLIGLVGLLLTFSPTLLSRPLGLALVAVAALVMLICYVVMPALADSELDWSVRWPNPAPIPSGVGVVRRWVRVLWSDAQRLTVAGHSTLEQASARALWRARSSPSAKKAEIVNVVDGDSFAQPETVSAMNGADDVGVTAASLSDNRVKPEPIELAAIDKQVVDLAQPPVMIDSVEFVVTGSLLEPPVEPEGETKSAGASRRSERSQAIGPSDVGFVFAPDGSPRGSEQPKPGNDQSLESGGWHEDASMIQVEPYIMLSVAGQGGFAVVYRALDTAGREVAIKVLTATRSAEERRRFEREKEALAKLADVDGVVDLIDNGTTKDGMAYLVMPFYHRTIADKLGSEAYGWEPALEIARGLVTTLQACHERNVFHRDLKPSNLLLTGASTVALCDFGLTQITDGRSLSTRTAFTPNYCAPEILVEGTQGSDPERVDVYGVGVTLWAMLAGQRPFMVDQAEAPVLYNRIATEPLPSIPNVPRWFNDSIATATAKSPEHRYGTMSEFKYALFHGSGKPERDAADVMKAGDQQPAETQKATLTHFSEQHDWYKEVHRLITRDFNLGARPEAGSAGNVYVVGTQAFVAAQSLLDHYLASGRRVNGEPPRVIVVDVVNEDAPVRLEVVVAHPAHRLVETDGTMVEEFPAEHRRSILWLTETEQGYRISQVVLQWSEPSTNP